MQNLKVQISCYKTYRIRNIILKNMSPHNLGVAPKVRSSQQNSITKLITKSRTTFITFYSQFKLKNLFSKEKFIRVRDLIFN